VEKKDLKMLTNFDNKSLTTSPESRSATLAELAEKVAALRADEAAQSTELHSAQAARDAADTSIREANFATAKGHDSPENLTVALLAQTSAQNRISAVVQKLGRTRVELSQAVDALTEAKARHAADEAAALEREIVSELLAFVDCSMDFAKQCAKLVILRRRAQEIGRLITPPVMEALAPVWGEVRPGLEDRLALIAKCAMLPEEPAAILLAAARERAHQAQAEAERARKNEADRLRGGKSLIAGTFTTEGDIAHQGSRW
jgi:hypothetical protein